MAPPSTGLLPISFSAPPSGGMAGLALLARKPIMPASASWRLKNMAVPKWPELRMLTAMP